MLKRICHIFLRNLKVFCDGPGCINDETYFKCATTVHDKECIEGYYICVKCGHNITISIPISGGIID